MDYDWPGNVRELENVIERAVVLATGPRIGADLIPDHVRTAPRVPDPEVRRAAGRHLVQGRHHQRREAADRIDARGRRRRAEAGRRAAGIKPTTLNEMIKRYDIGVRGADRHDDGSDRARTPATELTRE